MTYYDKFNTQLGTIILVGDSDGISQLILNSDRSALNQPIHWQHSSTFFSDAKQQLREYFAGERAHFELKLNPFGSVFARHAWKQLQSLSYGNTTSYKDIAASLGDKNAIPTLLTAYRNNPLPILIPTHRVIGQENKLSSQQRLLQSQLLQFEQKHVKRFSKYHQASA